MEVSKYDNKVDILDEIFFEIEKDIKNDLSFSTDRKDDFCTALRHALVTEKVYRDPALTRDILLKRMHIGKDAFTKSFKYCFGISFRECINELRLKESVILLKQSDLSIEGIADKVGFGSTRTFQRQFQSKYNTSPQAYRHKETATK